jgi:hypothetical protein
VHPVFQELAARASAVSLCDPGFTTAFEFTDGKLMFGLMQSLDEITYPRILAVAGEAALVSDFAAADLVALVNWTMVPHMTAIYAAIAEQVLPRLLADKERLFFFDLADPAKRQDDDLRAALLTLARFQAFGPVTLGLNLKEALQVHRLLGFAPTSGSEAGLRAMAAQIRQHLGLATVVVHPSESAACATAAGTFWVPGPYAEKPLITTGAGDHFNAGFTLGQLLGLDPEACLATGAATSGYYVRTARSPTLDELVSFLSDWN